MSDRFFSKTESSFGACDFGVAPGESLPTVSKAGLGQLVSQYLPKIDLNGDRNMSLEEIVRAEQNELVPAHLRGELEFLRKTFNITSRLSHQDDDSYYDPTGISKEDIKLISKVVKPYEAPKYIGSYAVAGIGGCTFGGLFGAYGGGLPGGFIGCALGAGSFMYGKNKELHESYELTREADRKAEYEQRRLVSSYLQRHLVD